MADAYSTDEPKKRDLSAVVADIQKYTDELVSLYQGNPDGKGQDRELLQDNGGKVDEEGKGILKATLARALKAKSNA